MRFYVAAYIGAKPRLQQIHELLRARGHGLTVDWTQGGGFPLAERETRPEEVRACAVRDMDGVLSCDAFVLVAEPVDGRAKYVELGAAIAAHLSSGKPRVFVVGRETHQSVFYYHPSVTRLGCFEEVLEMLEDC